MNENSFEWDSELYKKMEIFENFKISKNLKILKNLKNFTFSKYLRFSIFTNSVILRSTLRILHFILELLVTDINF